MGDPPYPLTTQGAHNKLPNYRLGSGRTHSHCSPWVCADAQLLGLWPGRISTQCQQSWQVHYLCNKSLMKAPACCTSPGRFGYEVCGRMGWCSLSSLMRLCSPNLTANRIFTLCAFIVGRERGWRQEAAQTWAVPARISKQGLCSRRDTFCIL